MKPPRVTIAGLMMLVGFVAANFAAVRAFARWTLLSAEGYWFVVAPFGSTLLFALHRLAISRGTARLFWGGFLIMGSMAFGPLVGCIIGVEPVYRLSRFWRCYEALLRDGYRSTIDRTHWLPYSAASIAEAALVGVAFYLSWMAVAMAGGLIARSIARVATRRRGSVAAGDDGRAPAVR